METLLALLWLVFGGDVTRLRHPDFHTRDAAHKRLARAGVLAWPVLLASKDGHPEVRNRIDILMKRCPTVAEVVAWSVLRDRDAADEWVAGVGEAMARDAGLAAVICAAVDRTAKFWATDSRRWVEAVPYVTGDRGREFAHMLRATRAKLFAPPLCGISAQDH